MGLCQTRRAQPAFWRAILLR